MSVIYGKWAYICSGGGFLPEFAAESPACRPAAVSSLLLGKRTMPEAVSEGITISRTTVRLVKGDITELEVDAFVFYAETDLSLGSGIGTCWQVSVAASQTSCVQGSPSSQSA